MSKLVPIAAITMAVLAYRWFFSSDGFEPESISGQRILVTGASSGIGEQLAYQYCMLGARVAIAARRLQRLEAVAKKCHGLGGPHVVFLQADLGYAEDRLRVMKEVKEQFGGLDQLILNHAVANFGRWTGSSENMTTFMKELHINFVSYVDLASQALGMLKASHGRIGVVSSAISQMPSPGLTSYAAGKSCLQGFFGALAQELRIWETGVSVTLCLLGPVDTEMIHRFFPPEVSQHVILGYFVKKYLGSAEETAVTIMRAVSTRQRQIYNELRAYLGTLAYNVFPSVVEPFLAINAWVL